MRILVANIGSTSFKYRLYDMDSGAVLARGLAERVGGDYEAAIGKCLSDVGIEGLAGVGFKAVHAGPLTGARLVDETVLQAMEEFTFLAPAHNPPYIEAMRAFRRSVPELPLVALFETAFYQDMTEAAITYSLPYEWKAQLGIRRYGFHGASHRAASESAQELLGRRDIRHISCHLGGSSSVAAIRNGVAIDISFGVSVQSGIPHNNRAGDVDAFAALYAMKRLGLSVDEMADVLSAKSGLAGLSGSSGDMRDLAAVSEERAQLTRDVFVRAIRHYVGAFLVELGGVDILTFSGGIGENEAGVRRAVCGGLSGFGLELDELATGPKLSTSSSKAAIYIVPADEERIVAQATAAVIREMVQ